VCLQLGWTHLREQIREYVASHFARETEFAVIFEAGDKGKGKLQKRISEDSGLQVTFLPKKDFVPLQAADWLAYEANKMAAKFGEGLCSLSLSYAGRCGNLAISSGSAWCLYA